MAQAGTTTESLPVANEVLSLSQACRVDDQQQVPEKYLKKNPGEEVVVDCPIPVIDLRKLQDPQSSEEECAKLASVCLDWGLFQLVNHGLPEEVTGNMMKDVVEFMNQPLEVKKEYAQQADSVQGYGKTFFDSETQRTEWVDKLYLEVHPSESRDLRFWPTRPESFRHSVDTYCSGIRDLKDQLLEFMAKGVGADPASLRGVFSQVQGMRVNYYPPCRNAADRLLGVAPHKDGCGITLLLQKNNDVVGLQVKKDGKWTAVQVQDGSIIVNVGDLLQMMSNGKFTSIEHRVVIDPTRERVSVALFHFPSQDTMVGPLPEFVKGDKVRYRPATYKDYLTQYYFKREELEHLEGFKLEQ